MHMNLGIVLSYFNHKYFADELSIWCEFVPQMIFLNAMFGYLCFLIILKWLTGSSADLYHVLIYMFLSPGDVDCGGNCPQNVLFPGQAFIQVLLLLAMLVAVPWMLVPKPYILKQRHEKKKVCFFAVACWCRCTKTQVPLLVKPHLCLSVNHDPPSRPAERVAAPERA